MPVRRAKPPEKMAWPISSTGRMVMALSNVPATTDTSRPIATPATAVAASISRSTWHSGDSVAGSSVEGTNRSKTKIAVSSDWRMTLSVCRAAERRTVVK